MICPYCNAPVELVDSARVYGGISFGFIWCCSRYPDCDARVGVHPGTDRPLGVLANRELRNARMAAHKAFDKIWKSNLYTRPFPDGVKRPVTIKGARSAAYAWLAQSLAIDPQDCHIGQFDEPTCIRVIQLCTERTNGI